jgi:hypothetical protein
VEEHVSQYNEKELRILTEKTEGKKPLGRPTHRLQNYIENNVK